MAGTIPDDFRRQVYNAETGRTVARFRLGPTFLTAWRTFGIVTMLRGECAWHLCLELIEGEPWERAPYWWPAVLEEARAPVGVPLSRSPLSPRIPLIVACYNGPIG